MQITRLELENFCCFERMSVELDPNFNLIIGINGAGKTSFLKAVAVALGGWLCGFPGVDRRELAGDERRKDRIGWRDAVVECLFVIDKEIYLSADLYGEPFQNMAPILLDKNIKSIEKYVENLIYLINKKIPTNLPVISYHDTTRLLVSTLGYKKIKENNILNGYIDCIQPGSDIGALSAWMEWREEIRIEKVAELMRKGRSFTPDMFEDSLFEAVSLAAGGCVEHGARLRYSIKDKELLLEFQDGRDLPFRLLSDGYRSMVSLVADIAWRAAQLNPHYGKDAAARATGVVLIDEIDLCLHPTWQHRVCQDLRRIFPGIQFIATTHSPQVISSARPEWVRIVSPDGAVRGVTHSFGKDSNAILREIMGSGSRLPEMAARLEALEALIGGGRLLEARGLLEELRRDLGFDQKLLGLEWELRDQELHGSGEPADGGGDAPTEKEPA